jgi:hypothetical protein
LLSSKYRARDLQLTLLSSKYRARDLPLHDMLSEDFYVSD